MKRKKLEKIWESYFEILNDYFGGLYRRLKGDRAQTSQEIVNLPLASDIIAESMEDLQEDIANFWKKHNLNLREEIKKVKDLNTCYGGDVSPSEANELISRTSLYVDTIVMPDPIFTICLNWKKTIADKSYLFYLIKHAFNILNIRDFFFADLDKPIVVLYPRTVPFQRTIFEQLDKAGKDDTIKYFSELTGIDFSSWEDLQSFLKKQVSANVLAKSIIKKEILIPDFKSDSVQQSLEESHALAKNNFPSLRSMSIGETFGYGIYGRMIGFYEHMFYSAEFNSEPLFDNPNSWFIFNMQIKSKNEKLTEKIRIRRDLDSLIINALQLKDFKWLGNVPLDKIISMRKEGELSDLREIFRKGIHEIKYSSDDELEKVAKDISASLNQEFHKFETKVSSTEKELRRKYNIDIPLTVVGNIASVTSSLAMPLSLLLSVPIGAISFWSIYKDVTGKKKELEDLKTRPMGVLFEAHRGGK